MKVKSIEIWRLLFTISIVLCHTEVLPWSISLAGEREISFSTHAVEFFFILSGFLMARTASKMQGKGYEKLGEETLAFLVKKMRPIYPVYLFAAAFELAIHYFLRTAPVEGLYWRVWDFLFLRATGLGEGQISAVGAGWYLSAMFLAMWILYPLLRRFTDAFLHIIAPLVAVLLFGWFESVYGHINFALSMEHGVCLGLLRGISEMCIGVFSCALCEKLKQKFADDKPSIMITAVELVALGGMFPFLMHFRRTRTDFLGILLLCIGVIAAFSGKSYTNVWLHKLDDKWTSWISTYSLCLYLNHYVWIKTLQDWKLAVPFKVELAMILGLSLLSSITCYVTLKTIATVWKHMKEKRLKLIESN